MASSMLGAQSAYATPIGLNIIANGDAEADIGSATGADIGTVSGFVKTGQFTVVTYEAGGGFPNTSSPGPALRGKNFFAGGPSASESTGTQLISISDLMSSVDAGLITFDLSAYLGGFSSQRDNAILTLNFLDVASGILSAASLGPVSPIDRADVTGMLFRETMGAVPIGTRSLQVQLKLTRVDGIFDDGYADNLSLSLATSAVGVPEPGTVSISLLGLLLVRVARQRLGQRVAFEVLRPASSKKLLTNKSGRST